MQATILLTALMFQVLGLQELEDRVPVDFSQPLISRVECFAGDPFGVGLVTFRMPPDGGDVNSSLILQSGAIELTEKNNRVLYQVVGQQAAARFFRKIGGGAEVPTDQMHAMWFLFKGTEPLELTLHGSDATEFEAVPVGSRQNQFKRRVEQWWREYRRIAALQDELSDYPNLIEKLFDDDAWIALGA